MGYACPVCGHPQSDARHLANHLAFTALARGGDHERWLDDHVPDWESMDERSLGERVTEHADETEYPQVFEDTTAGSGHGAGHAHDGGTSGHDGPDHGTGRHDAGRERKDSALDDARKRAEGAFSDDADEVLERARELTRRRRENADEESETE